MKFGKIAEKIVSILVEENLDIVTAKQVLEFTQGALLVSPVAAVFYQGLHEWFTSRPHGILSCDVQ